jgi:hypothetical protein
MICYFVKGRSIWTKIIRNHTALDYLFNGEAYDFNYQFQNSLPQPIQLYPVELFSILFFYSLSSSIIVGWRIGYSMYLQYNKQKWNNIGKHIRLKYNLFYKCKYLGWRKNKRWNVSTYVYLLSSNERYAFLCYSQFWPSVEGYNE